MRADDWRIVNEQNLLVGCVVMAYVAANMFAAAKLHLFTATQASMRLALYGAAVLLWGSFILWGIRLMDVMRRLDDEEAAGRS
jgi:hypothetical protein